MTDTERPFRWGIISTGGIAKAFARDITLLPDAEVVAVGSRSQGSADAFGDELGIPAGTIASRISRCLGQLRSKLEGRKTAVPPSSE